MQNFFASLLLGGPINFTPRLVSIFIILWFLMIKCHFSINSYLILHNINIKFVSIFVYIFCLFLWFSLKKVRSHDNIIITMIYYECTYTHIPIFCTRIEQSSNLLFSVCISLFFSHFFAIFWKKNSRIFFLNLYKFHINILTIFSVYFYIFYESPIIILLLALTKLMY